MKSHHVASWCNDVKTITIAKYSIVVEYKGMRYLLGAIKKVDVLIIGAGAAGLFCAIQAGKRGRRVWVLDHANKAGKKILMSGGGRCNFTNTQVTHVNFISHNPQFCRSALSRYTSQHLCPFGKRA